MISMNQFNNFPFLVWVYNALPTKDSMPMIPVKFRPHWLTEREKKLGFLLIIRHI